MNLHKLKSGEIILLDGNILILYRIKCKPRVIQCKTNKEAKLLLKEYKNIIERAVARFKTCVERKSIGDVGD